MPSHMVMAAETQVRNRVAASLGARRPQVRRLTTVVDRFLFVALLAAGLNLLLWRAGMLRFVGPAGWALFGVEVVTVLWMLGSTWLFTGRTVRVERGPEPLPGTTLDILIPVAGEPLDMIEGTVRAAQAIDWPARIIICNDGWMAGSREWQGVERLAARLGVECLTRTNGPKGKAGNLNNALPHVRADAILILDADHRVVPDVAQQLLGYLRYEDVAFVATPQEFVGSDKDALNPTEPVFYRATQPARDRFGLAFSTGNGVVYRRDAIMRIGGFSEWSVVEDLHTSIRIHAGGWRSVFHPRPVSIGLAPKTAAEYARQRLRWSIDSLRILRFDPPWRRKELTFRAKLHYSHTLLSYLVAMIQLGFLFGPPAWILGRLTLLHDADWRAQLLHLGPWIAAVVAVLLRWAGFKGAIRSLRLTTALLPVVFWAALWGLVSQSAGRGGVTKKANLPRFNGLVFAGLALPLGLVGVMAWGVVDERSGGSDLAMVWAAILASVAIGPMVKFGTSRLWAGLWQVAVIGTAVSLAAGSVAVTRFAWEAPEGLYAAFQPIDATMADATIVINELGSTVVVGPAIPAPVRPLDDAIDEEVDRGVRTSVTAGEGIYVGYTSDALPHDLGDVERWADEVTAPQIVHWYQQWGSGDSRFRGDWLAEVSAQGAIPMISWEAWAKPDGSFHMAEQELGQMDEIAAGDYDDYIDEWAEAAADYGDPILLRPFHEMNGTWYPWSVGVNGNTQEDFIAGWRHVVARFRLAGADNVSFVWSINTLASFDEGRGVEAYYPGDDYVDWVATSGFNWDDYQPEWSSWVTPEWVFAETYRLLASFDKPVMFAEIGTGTNTGDEVAWVADAMDWFETLPQLGAIVWFDRSYDGGITFELNAEQQATFAGAVAASERFGPTIVFEEHPIVESGTAAPVPRLLSEIQSIDDPGVVPDVQGIADNDGS